MKGLEHDADRTAAEPREAVLIEIAEIVTRNAPLAVRGTRLAIIKGREIPMHEAEMLAEAFRERNLHTVDSLEGPKAFVEKRAPEWQCR
jgi:enoyl-CoA hydratase/carnithine racemase